MVLEDNYISNNFQSKWDFKVILHEGNAVLGKVNKFFVCRCNCMWFWPTTAPNGSKLFYSLILYDEYCIKKNKTFRFPSTGRLKIVVIGGSQGATLFSKIILNLYQNYQFQRE